MIAGSPFLFPAADSGVRVAGFVDWTALGSITYTSSGSKTLGGVTFNLVGVDGTNTVVFDSNGWKAVGGSANVGVQVIDLTTFNITDESAPAGWVWEHGAILETAALTSFSVQDSAGTSFFACQRINTGVSQVFCHTGGIPSANVQTTIPGGGTNVLAHALYYWGRLGRYWLATGSAPGQISPEDLDFDAGTSNHSGVELNNIATLSTAKVDMTIGAIRGVYTTRTTAWIYR